MTSRSIGQATVDVVADTSSFQSQLQSGVRKAARAAGKDLDGLKGAMIGVGIAAATFVGTKLVGFLGDAARAAAEDERSQRLLASALENSTGATDTQIASTEGWIDAMARTKGVADDQLRPALAELARATGSTATAQDQLGIALDIAAAKGIDVETVTVAMGKAARGNVGALGRLGIATRNAAGETLTYEQVLDEATKLMGGSALEAANTLEGQMERLNIIWEEQKESIGTAFIPILSRAGSTLSFFASEIAGPTEHAIDGFMTRLSELAYAGIDPFADRLRSATAILVDTNKKAIITEQSVGALKDMFGLTAPELQQMSAYLVENQEQLGISDAELKEMTSSLNINAQALIDQARGLGVNRGALEETTLSAEELEQAEKDAEAAQKKWNDSLSIGAELLNDLRDAASETSDNIFTLQDASARAAEAQAEVNRLEAENLQGSPEYLEAVRAAAEANADVDAAFRAIIASGPTTREEWVKQQTDLGLNASAANALADELERIGAFNPKPINFVVTVNGRKVAVDPRGTIGFGSGGAGLPGAQHGGHFNAGQVLTVGEAGRELFVPDVPGTVIPHGQTERILNSSFAPTVNINVSGGGDPERIGVAVERALRRVADARVVR
jgi:hypothetical protein